ncbi:UDP-N-acetylmuramoyl-L-alanine--D-glutamate ligase [Bifidobacterium stellenboschense]|uniref:UDP-N-acetylmuramoylalanine--D-glutamate ligase n=1 Tax=Bifidobacterium stellenboschense TaxID=762211 RepID=A0A087DQS2_9BIFI|nr:UDP-N-acetylmuramoyl-L-alanine--D-glutamate ligase [Bifidobacterium stellenboschense]KFI97872.1 UDP-N-acetylmuramoylalanine--D-glutamate ligase [Bifidobacterium stellenboschense]
MDITGKTVVIAGLGVSGTSLAEVLRERGAHVIGVDERKPEADLHSFDAIDWDTVDYVMSSPVFNPRTPFVLEAQRRGIPVMSEVEFAWRLRVDSAHTGRPAGWIGITGTNGKTSTTEMTSAMLTACGLDAPCAGNIASGNMAMSLSRCATNPAHDVLCVELSSFQLHFTDSLALDCAAITNIADDHLDWHGGRENYAADKAKVFHGVKRALVYNADDALVTAKAEAAEPAEGCLKVGFTLHEPEAGQIGVADGWIVDRSGVAGGEPGETTRIAPIAEFTHLTEPDGTIYPHLLADALTALALVLGYGADKAKALEALKAFHPGGHRIETVAATAADAQGRTIRFVDDSKATNAHAANASLTSFADGSVVWIAGGLAKGSRFEHLVADRKATIKAAVIIGKDQRPMLDAFAASAPDTPLTVIDPEPNGTVMDRAVEAAGAYAEPGDVVLMAPACASMDQFVSYADRGNRFADAARRWVKAHGED